MKNSFREDIKRKVSFSFELPKMFGCGEGRKIYKEPRKQFKIQRARGVTGGKSQNCTGKKCTEHELVLLMFIVLKRLDDLL